MQVDLITPFIKHIKYIKKVTTKMKKKQQEGLDRIH